jgi:hypothetical protein
MKADVRLRASGLSAFFGRTGGVGETETTTSAIFTAGWRSKGAATASAVNGIRTFIDSNARTR